MWIYTRGLNIETFAIFQGLIFAVSNYLKCRKWPLKLKYKKLILYSTHIICCFILVWREKRCVSVWRMRRYVYHIDLWVSRILDFRDLRKKIIETGTVNLGKGGWNTNFFCKFLFFFDIMPEMILRKFYPNFLHFKQVDCDFSPGFEKVIVLTIKNMKLRMCLNFP